MVSHDEAASYLGVWRGRVGWLIAREHLQGSRYGVVVGSIRSEKQWRATASAVQKARRALRDALATVLDAF